MSIVALEFANGFVAFRSHDLLESARHRMTVSTFVTRQLTNSDFHYTQYPVTRTAEDK